jgi:Amt family ammonium transporter
MEPVWAVVTGFLAGIVTVWGEKVLERFRLDDVVGAIPVHGFCGVWGTLAAGLFYAGDMFNPGRIIVQLIGAGTAFVWALAMSLVVYGIIHYCLGMLRADNLHQQRGLDSTEHYEVGYPEFQKEFGSH